MPAPTETTQLTETTSQVMRHLERRPMHQTVDPEHLLQPFLYPSLVYKKGFKRAVSTAKHTVLTAKRLLQKTLDSLIVLRMSKISSAMRLYNFSPRYGR